MAGQYLVIASNYHTLSHIAAHGLLKQDTQGSEGLPFDPDTVPGWHDPGKYLIHPPPMGRASVNFTGRHGRYTATIGGDCLTRLRCTACNATGCVGCDTHFVADADARTVLCMSCAGKSSIWEIIAELHREHTHHEPGEPDRPQPEKIAPGAPADEVSTTPVSILAAVHAPEDYPGHRPAAYCSLVTNPEARVRKTKTRTPWRTGFAAHTKEGFMPRATKEKAEAAAAHATLGTIKNAYRTTDGNKLQVEVSCDTPSLAEAFQEAAQHHGLPNITITTGDGKDPEAMDLCRNIALWNATQAKNKRETHWSDKPETIRRGMPGHGPATDPLDASDSWYKKWDQAQGKFLVEASNGPVNPLATLFQDGKLAQPPDHPPLTPAQESTVARLLESAEESGLDCPEPLETATLHLRAAASASRKPGEMPHQERARLGTVLTNTYWAARMELAGKDPADIPHMASNQAMYEHGIPFMCVKDAALMVIAA